MRRAAWLSVFLAFGGCGGGGGSPRTYATVMVSFDSTTIDQSIMDAALANLRMLGPDFQYGSGGVTVALSPTAGCSISYPDSSTVAVSGNCFNPGFASQNTQAVFAIEHGIGHYLGMQHICTMQGQTVAPTVVAPNPDQTCSSVGYGTATMTLEPYDMAQHVESIVRGGLLAPSSLDVAEFQRTHP